MPIISPSKVPIVKRIESIPVQEVKLIELPNAVPVYILSGGKSAAIKVDFIFQAGAWYANKGLVAHFCNDMLLEGTDKLSASKLMERLDFYGSYVQPMADKDFAGISLYGMSDKLGQMLKLIDVMIKRSTFPEKKLRILLGRYKQQFIIDQAKPGIIANKTLMTKLFGSDHPYGRYSAANDFDFITRNELIEHHDRFYGNTGLTIIISGKVNDKEIRLLEKFFGTESWLNQTYHKPQHEIKRSSEREIQVSLKNTVQSAIRMSSLIVPRQHPDYCGLQVLNTILGGYFGSRLMKNLREEKALTYGISSGIQNLAQASLITISTEVGKEFALQARDEIWKEMEILKGEPVSQNELDRVKNYFLGNLLHNFEGPINSSDAFRSLWEAGVDFSYVGRLVDAVKKISPEEIQALAVHYLNRSDFVEVIAG